MKATYVSVWDGGVEVRTSCEYDSETLDVTDIESADVDGLDNLEREHIELPDGTEIERGDFTIDGDTDDTLSDEDLELIRRSNWGTTLKGKL